MSLSAVKSAETVTKPYLVTPNGAGQVANVPDIPDSVVKELVQEINQSGFAMLPNYVRPEDLRELQTFVEAAIEENGGQYRHFNGQDAVSGTYLAKLTDTPEFLSLIHRVYEGGALKPAPKQSLYQVVRCLKGQTGLSQSLIFHFDSYVLTVLLPIHIPASGNQGDLVMAPNIRKERPAYFVNLIDKVFVDNKITQSLIKRFFKSGQLKLKRVKMIPGNLYLFWGYRSLHANEPCDPEHIRATALYHFGDPHADSALRQKLGRAKT